MQQQKVLLVEDDVDLRSIIGSMIRSANLLVIEVESKAKALDALSADQEILVVVSDIMMPGGTGIDLLKDVRGLGLRLPFVFLTAHETVDNVKSAMRLGASNFLTKPFDPRELEDAIFRALNIGSRIRRIDGRLEDFAERDKIRQDERMICRMMRLTADIKAKSG